MAGSAAGNALFGASCPSVALCVLVGTRGAILTSTEPFAAAAPPPSGSAKDTGKGGKRPRGPKRPRARIAHLTLRVPAGAGSQAGPRRARLLVRFYANGPVRRFECRLDRHRFRRCRSPLRRGTVRRGVHVVSVRAVGSTGRRGPVARKRFYVGRVCRRRNCVTGATEFPRGAGWKFVR